MFSFSLADQFLKYAGNAMDSVLNQPGKDDDDHPKCAELFKGKVGLAEWDCLCHGYTQRDIDSDKMGLIKGGLRPEFSCAGTEKWGENGDYKCLKSVLTKKK